MHPSSEPLKPHPADTSIANELPRLENVVQAATGSQDPIYHDQDPGNQNHPPSDLNRSKSNLGDQTRHLPSSHAPWIYQLQLISILVFFAIWGLLTRLGLTAIGNFDGQNVFSLLLVQIVGCTIMGTAVALQARLTKIHLLLYLAITTGYCGSVTTFSSWMLQVFQAFSNSSKLSRSRFSDFLDGLNLTYVTLGLSLYALQTGLHLGNLIEAFLTARCPPTRVQSAACLLPSKSLAKYRSTSIIIILAGPLTWAGSLLIFLRGPSRWRGPISYSMIISPAGTILRYYLAKLNVRHLSTTTGLPIGTYLANLIATSLLALFSALQFTPNAHRNAEYCASLQGLRDGFCGCLSTISTFFFELHRSGPDRKSVV